MVLDAYHYDAIRCDWIMLGDAGRIPTPNPNSKLGVDTDERMGRTDIVNLLSSLGVPSVELLALLQGLLSCCGVWFDLLSWCRPKPLDQALLREDPGYSSEVRAGLVDGPIVGMAMISG